jgi:hypothetical protein
VKGQPSVCACELRAKLIRLSPPLRSSRTHHHVEPSKLVDRLVDGRLDLLLLADVAFDRQASDVWVSLSDQRMHLLDGGAKGREGGGRGTGSAFLAPRRQVVDRSGICDLAVAKELGADSQVYVCEDDVASFRREQERRLESDPGSGSLQVGHMIESDRLTDSIIT